MEEHFQLITILNFLKPLYKIRIFMLLNMGGRCVEASNRPWKKSETEIKCLSSRVAVGSFDGWHRFPVCFQENVNLHF